MGTKCTVFDSVQKLAAALADRIAEGAGEAIEARGAFRLVLSGGSVIDMLASTSLFTAGARADAPSFERWHVFLVDERCVPIADGESTFGRMRDLFRDGAGESSSFMERASFAAPYTGGSASEAAASYARVVGDGPIDLAILGLGPDGHSASLFPPVSGDMLSEARTIVPIYDSPKAPPERITFSLPALQALLQRALVVACGASKAPVVKAIVADRCADYPASHIDCAEFFLDRPAASLLEASQGLGSGDHL